MTSVVYSDPPIHRLGSQTGPLARVPRIARPTCPLAFFSTRTPNVRPRGGQISYYVTPFLVSAVILVLSAVLMNSHLATLPFHSRAENACRGGIYCAVCWTAFASLIVSAVAQSRPAAAPAAAWHAFLHWTLIAGVPLVFAVGVVAVKMRRHRINRSIDRLRRKWEAGETPLPAGAGGRSLHRTASTSLQSVGFGAASVASGGRVSGALAGGGTLFDHFFESEDTAGRLFESSRQALLVMRVLLYRRERADVPFFVFLVQVGHACEFAPLMMGLIFLD